MNTYKEGRYQTVSKQEREEEIMNIMLSNNLREMTEYIDQLVYNAYIAGYQGSKGVGLNLAVQERADDYCKSKGLRV